MASRLILPNVKLYLMSSLNYRNPMFQPMWLDMELRSLYFYMYGSVTFNYFCNVKIHEEFHVIYDPYRWNETDPYSDGGISDTNPSYFKFSLGTLYANQITIVMDDISVNVNNKIFMPEEDNGHFVSNTPMVLRGKLIFFCYSYQ